VNNADSVMCILDLRYVTFVVATSSAFQHVVALMANGMDGVLSLAGHQPLFGRASFLFVAASASNVIDT
jgi:hypothetical protein